MFQQFDHHFFEKAIFQSLGGDPEILAVNFKSGGCINNAVQVITQDKNYFLKWNESESLDLFLSEKEGIELLRKTEALKVPEVLGYGEIDHKVYLILEYLESNPRQTDYWQKLGQGIAQLHANSEKKFGLAKDNYIGRLVQKNEFRNNWLDFFIDCRLEPQLGLAIYNRRVDAAWAQRFRQIYPSLYDFFPAETASLLHGDLWSGNVITGPDGAAWVLDPAVYYGHREAEIAFTHLFGGFDNEFYRAYEESFPMEPGFSERIPVYNLYPLLVHLNLFGESYLGAIESIIKKLRGR
jgi:protein-ribulosamine 3-kinase